MILIAGLGNPGKEYEKTRHNIGFMVLDQLAKSFETEFKNKSLFNAEIAKAQFNGFDIILAKPSTFMNNSGQALKKIIDYYNIYESDTWVIHDDLDLEIGTMRVRKGGSSAGQKGVESVIENFGTPEFIRFRIGIKPKKGPALNNSGRQKIPAEEFVLKRFSKDEKEVIDEKTKQVIGIIRESLGKDVEETTYQ